MRVTTISSPSRSSRPSARVSAKLRVVMFGPKPTSSAVQPRKAAVARRASVTSESLRTLVSNAPPRFALSSRRYLAIAWITSSGTCEPAGPSKKARPRLSAVNRARTASTSRTAVLIDATLSWPHVSGHRGTDRARHRVGTWRRLEGDRPQRRPQHVRGSRGRAGGRRSGDQLRPRPRARAEDPQLRPGRGLVGLAGAGRALLGAAGSPRAHDGSARGLMFHV